MEELNIRNRTQVKLGGDGIEMGKVIDFHNTLVNNIHGKGLEELSEVEQLKLENKRKRYKLDILKVQGIGKEVVPTVVIDLVEQLKGNYSIKLILDVLNIPKSTYYRWKNKTYKNDTVTQKSLNYVKLTTIPTVIVRLQH